MGEERGLREFGNRFVICLTIAAAMTGCGREKGNTSGDSFGTISAAISFTPSDGVAAVQITVDRGGAQVATRTIPIPSGTPDGGPAADAFFVLPPGVYSVTATALDPNGSPSRVCMSASATATVTTGQTTEVTLALFCSGPGNGGLDVVVTAEHAPTITNLSFDPNKFVVVCEPVTITVSASSPDGLALTYTWKIVSSLPATGDAVSNASLPQPPPGATSVLVPNGNKATVDTTTAGDYAVTVTVTDTNGHSASLTFPVHVLAGDGCAPVPRAAAASSVQQLFSLKPGSSVPAFTDIGASNPSFAAVQAVAPYLNRQLLCFGCALVSKFLPDVPSTRGEDAVLLTSVLVSRGLLTLLSPADADTALAMYADGGTVAPPARPIVATALKGGVLTALPGNLIALGSFETSADSAATLARVAAAFGLGGAP